MVDGTPGSTQVPESYLRRVLATVGIALLGVLVIALVALALEVFLATFAGVLLGVFLLALRDGVARVTPLEGNWALAVVVLLLLALLAAAGFFLAPQLSQQVEEFAAQLPAVLERVQALLGRHGLDGALEEAEGGGMVQGAIEGLGTMVMGLAGVLGLLVTILFVGLFVAANPSLYVNGIVSLMPRPARPRTRQVLDEMGNTLRWFLVARAVAMTLVGVTTAVALWLLGVPLALLLGLIAGLLTFVPYLGPIAAGVPILAFAMLEGMDTMLLTLLAYTVIQQVEGNLFDPLILQRILHLPPVVTIVSQILGAVLAGPLGIAVATPLAAVGQVMVRRVYREEVLGEPPQEEHEDPDDRS
jgi:predicted PurR-regulated permease PerM